MGDINVDLALKPNVRVEGIRIDNADWSPEPHMLKLPLLALGVIAPFPEFGLLRN